MIIQTGNDDIITHAGNVDIIDMYACFDIFALLLII